MTKSRAYGDVLRYHPGSNTFGVMDAAEIPEEFRADGIRWLVLDEDEQDTGGVFLYCHRSLQEESEYDGWHEDLAKAQLEAAREWGVLEEAWVPQG